MSNNLFDTVESMLNEECDNENIEHVRDQFFDTNGEIIEIDINDENIFQIDDNEYKHDFIDYNNHRNIKSDFAVRDNNITMQMPREFDVINYLYLYTTMNLTFITLEHHYSPLISIPANNMKISDNLYRLDFNGENNPLNLVQSNLCYDFFRLTLTFDKNVDNYKSILGIRGKICNRKERHEYTKPHEVIYTINNKKNYMRYMGGMVGMACLDTFTVDNTVLSVPCNSGQPGLRIYNDGDYEAEVKSQYKKFDDLFNV